MGYEDSFYTKTNITGYTGDLNDNPTVYFQNGTRFGRITQDHSNPNNIGRNLVRDKADYSIGNTGTGGVAQEYYDGAVKHTSRNRFEAVTNNNRDTLATAISRFPDKKPK